MADFKLTSCERNVTSLGLELRRGAHRRLSWVRSAGSRTHGPATLASPLNFLLLSSLRLLPTPVCIPLRVQPHPGSRGAPGARTAPELPSPLHTSQTGAPTRFTTHIHAVQVPSTLAHRCLHSLPPLRLAPLCSRPPAHHSALASKSWPVLPHAHPLPAPCPPLFFHSNHAPDLLCLQFPTQDLLHGSGDKFKFPPS